MKKISIRDNGRKVYYLKYYSTVVGVLNTEDNYPVNLEVEREDLFFDKINKVFFTKDETEAWIKNRVIPNSQRGLNKVLKQYNIDIEDTLWWWKLFLETKGMNVKDRLYINEEEYRESNPWDIILVSDNDDDYNSINISTTKALLNIDGACEKRLYRINGNLAIVKKSLQDNTIDGVAEELVFYICKKLGIDCSPSQYLGNSKCYSVIDENKELIHAGEFLNIATNDVPLVLSKLKRMNVPRKTILDYLRMVLLDIMTVQLDRNVTNFSFYKVNSIVHLYRMYDNGLSLFSATRLREGTEFSYSGQSSSMLTSLLIRELKSLGVSSVFNGELSKEYLTSIFSKFTNEYKCIRNLEINDVVDNIYERYMYIINSFK